MIVLTNRHKIPFQIDDNDFEVVSYYSWHIAHGYVVTTKPRPEQGSLLLHNFLLGPAPSGLEWDHKDRNPLNNQRANLRAVSHVVNKRNENLNAKNTTGIRGVSKNARQGYYLVTIRIKGERIYLGVFYSIEEAARARREAEDFYWGAAR